MIKIGLIDSGIGGISVLKGMIDSGIHAEYHYIYDNKFHPYGLKTTSELRAIAYKYMTYFESINVDIVVFACNTLTSASIESMRSMFKTTIVGVEPPIKPSTKNCKNVLVLATPFTINGDKLHKLVLEYSDINFYYPDVPSLASMIENYTSNKERDMIKEYLTHKLTKYNFCDGLVIGCTHYNFISDLIEEVLPNINIYSSINGVVSRVKSIIKEKNYIMEDMSFVNIICSDNEISPKKHFFISKYLSQGVLVTTMQ